MTSTVTSGRLSADSPPPQDSPLVANLLAVLSAVGGGIFAAFHPGAASAHAHGYQAASVLGGAGLAAAVKAGHYLQVGLQRAKWLTKEERELVDAYPDLRQAAITIQSNLHQIATSALVTGDVAALKQRMDAIEARPAGAQAIDPEVLEQIGRLAHAFAGGAPTVVTAADPSTSPPPAAG